MSLLFFCNTKCFDAEQWRMIGCRFHRQWLEQVTATENMKWSNFYPTDASHANISNIFAGGRKPKIHQPASNGSLDLGIKKRQREGKGLFQFIPAAKQTKWI